MAEDKKKRKITNRLRLKYRLVIMDDDTFQEKLSFILAPLNVIILFGSIMIFLVVLTIWLVAFTSLREYIPGYADVAMRQQVYMNAVRADSLANELRLRDLYLQNLSNIVSDDIPIDSVIEPDTTKSYADIEFSVSKQDSILRAKVAADERFNLQNFGNAAVDRSQMDIANVFFFSPVSGEITEHFDLNKEHYGVDLVTAPDSPVLAAMEGTVIMASWTYETGNVMAVQHAYGLTTFYKHNSVLLKKVGDKVDVGEAIAIVGSTGELTSGPHLHFELWHKGRPLNPADYVVF